MALKFNLVGPDCRVFSVALLEQIRHPPPTRGASQYIVRLDGKEVAFLSLDRLPGTTDLVVYEIFLDPEHRGRGIGTAVMRDLELFAIRQGYTRILLCPQPLDQTITRRDLTRWYTRLGYRRSPQSHDVMEKTLPAATRQTVTSSRRIQ
jgi:GNAT superfamily N-acetyltransferase